MRCTTEEPKCPVVRQDANRWRCQPTAVDLSAFGFLVPRQGGGVWGGSEMSTFSKRLKFRLVLRFHTVDGQNLAPERLWEIIVCWYLPGNQKPDPSERCCEMEFAFPSTETQLIRANRASTPGATPSRVRRTACRRSGCVSAPCNPWLPPLFFQLFWGALFQFIVFLGKGSQLKLNQTKTGCPFFFPTHHASEKGTLLP